MSNWGWGIITKISKESGPGWSQSEVTNYSVARDIYMGWMYATDPFTRIVTDAARSRAYADDIKHKNELRDRFGYPLSLEDTVPGWSQGRVEVQGHWNRKLMSRASSASSYQQHGGTRGTRTPSRRFKNIDAIPSGSRVTKPHWKTTARHPHGGVKSGHHYCKKGWLLVRVGDTNMCWKPPR